VRQGLHLCDSTCYVSILHPARRMQSIKQTVMQFTR
jgi:hypothetical protein